MGPPLSPDLNPIKLKLKCGTSSIQKSIKYRKPPNKDYGALCNKLGVKFQFRSYENI